jgi:hypothetical protein
MNTAILLILLQQFVAGLIDSLTLKYSIFVTWKSERMRKVLSHIMVPNIICMTVYLIISRYWILNMILYVPLVTIQILVNYYMLIKANSVVAKLFDESHRKEIDLIEKISDTISDLLFCNITLVSSTILYYIFRNIGIFKLICEILYGIIYSLIIGYTSSLNLLVESGLPFEQRLYFAENNLIYLIGYGMPLTVGYYTLPLIIYFAIQSLLVPLMIINSKKHFKPMGMPLSLPIISLLNKFNHWLFTGGIFLVKKLKK